jgi:hypothetical protein
MWDGYLENNEAKKISGTSYQKLQLQPLLFHFQFLQR